MTESIKYGRLGLQDLELKTSSTDTTFEVVLPDGLAVVLDKISLDSFTAYGAIDHNLQQSTNFLLEILTSNPSTNTQGRIFLFDTTDDVIRYMDGSAVQELVELDIAQTLTNKTLTNPVIAQINDSNGNELLQLTLAASAVNYIDITNAATNSDLIIRAEGDDANIDIDIQSKGDGSVLINGASIASFPVANQGDVLYYTGTEWAVLSAGTIGQTLTTQGSGANPTWDFPVPQRYISGFLLSNGTDTDHDIDITRGTCRGSDDDENIVTTATITKQIDASWAAGSAAGGLSSSLTLSASTWYHVHAIMVGGSADFGFDTSVTAANLVTDHSATAYRRIGSVLTDGSSNIVAFDNTVAGDFYWDAPSADISTVNPGTARVTEDISATVPTGVVVAARLNMQLQDTTPGTTNMWVGPLTMTDAAANTSNFVLRVIVASESDMTELFVLTDTSAQIGYRLNSSTADHVVRGSVKGWYDFRGQE